MGVFHIFKIVQIVPNYGTHHIWWDVGKQGVWIIFVKLGEHLVDNKAKGISQNGDNKKTNHAKFSEKNSKHFLPPWYAHVRVCIRGWEMFGFFSENLAWFVFLLPPFLNSPFALLPTIWILSRSPNIFAITITLDRKFNQRRAIQRYCKLI